MLSTLFHNAIPFCGLLWITLFYFALPVIITCKLVTAARQHLNRPVCSVRLVYNGEPGSNTYSAKYGDLWQNACCRAMAQFF